MNLILQFRKISRSLTDLYVGRKYHYEIMCDRNRFREFVLKAGPCWSLVLQLPRTDCKMVDPWGSPKEVVQCR